MSLSDFTPEGTTQSRLLCEDISSRSGGICILAFSRGKDVLPAWVWLRQFFHTILPFHTAAVPHLEFVDRSLAYYEQLFDTKIERFMDGEPIKAMNQKWYQPIERYDQLDSFHKGWAEFEDLGEYMREKHNLPDAWMAVAMTMNDNIFRRMNLKKLDAEGNLTYQGAIKNGYKTFYPTFDWTIDQSMEVLHKCNILLPDDYLLTGGSLAPFVNLKFFERLMTLFPEDFKRVEAMYPLIKALWARNQFRRMKVSGNGVMKKTVAEVLREKKLQQLESDIEAGRLVRVESKTPQKEISLVSGKRAKKSAKR